MERKDFTPSPLENHMLSDIEIQKMKDISMQKLSSLRKDIVSSKEKLDSFEKRCEQKLIYIQNYDQLTHQQKNIILERIKYWESLLDQQEVPDSLRINTQLVYITDQNNEYHLIKKLPNICFVPNIDLAYQVSLIGYQKVKEYGKDAPTPETILGILAQESMMTNASGDHGNSIDMCQLYKLTAKWLLNTNNDPYPFKYTKIFQKYIYFDDQDQHHFYDQESMVSFVYDFLVLAKGYKEGKEKKGIRKYNGGGEMAQNYANSVLKKIVEYSILNSKLNFGNIDSTNQAKFEEETLKKVEEATRIFFGEQAGENKNLKIYHDMIRRQYISYIKSISSTPHLRLDLIALEAPLARDAVRSSLVYLSVPDIEIGSPYILKEPGRTVYSYFEGHLWEAISYHNTICDTHNDNIGKIRLYFFKKDASGKRLKIYIKTKQEMRDIEKQGYGIFPEQQSDKIYIKPGSKIRYYLPGDTRNDYKIYVMPN